MCYLNFEIKPDAKTKKGTIRVINDKSGYDNNGDMSDGGEILKYFDKDFTCNEAARLWSSDIKFKGDLFQAKPRNAITIAAWIKIEEKCCQHSIFDTIGVSHKQGQFHFEVNDGVLRWFHRNECRKTVFETMAHTVPKGNTLTYHPEIIYLLLRFLSLVLKAFSSNSKLQDLHDAQLFTSDWITSIDCNKDACETIVSCVSKNSSIFPRNLC